MRRITSIVGGSNPRGNAAPLAVGVLGLAAVVAALWLFQAKPVETPEPSSLPTAAVPAPVAPKPVQTAEVTPVAAEQAKEVAIQQPTLVDDVSAHLAAGEFGPALDLALNASTPAEQAELIQLIAEAQIASGEFAAAKRTLKRLPLGFAADEATEVATMQESLAGGTGADFTQLIELIQNETGDEEYGPWLDIHGTGGTLSQFDSGVRVDPNGVLAMVSRTDREGSLAAVSNRARTAALNDDLARPSELRMVSLTRLEQVISERLASGKPVVETMRQLAGLSEIQYVFVYPEEREIVIAGPAEGWRYNEQGQPVGVETGRPTLQLDDLVTVLRTFSRDGMNIFGCSIDPRQDNLQALKDFVAASQARGPLASGGAARWAKQLGEKLGMQDVSVYGVPADSRIARVIVEADYRMKLIGIGKLDGGSQIPDYFQLLAANPDQASGRIDGLRWWMTLKLSEVLHSGNRTAFEFVGSTVRCQSENEFLDAQGQRVHTGDAEPTNRLFAANFTQNYGDLARREPVFADMEGVFNLAMVAALIQQDGLDRQVGWDRGTFRAGGGYVTASYPVPREVETVVNHRVFNGKDVIVQVAGGVKADVVALLQNGEARQVAPRLEGVAAKSRAGELPVNRWWWDAN